MNAILLFIGLGAFASPRVAIVLSDTLSPYTQPIPGLISELDQPATIIQLHGREGEAAQAMASLRHRRPEVIVAIGAKAAWSAKTAMPSTPLVYLSIIHPERYQISGPQVTGIAMTVDPKTYLSQFIGFFPNTKRIGVVSSVSGSSTIGPLKEAARDVGVTLDVRTLKRPREMRRLFREMHHQIDAFWVLPDRDLLTPESYRALTHDAIQLGVPLLVQTNNMVQAGGFFTVIPNAEEMGAQAARVVKRLLKGTAPSIIPIALPEQVQVVLNLRAIKEAEVPFEELMLDFADIIVD